eukprot:1191254-Pleurochrysis_carterae.AAC.1
MSARKSRTRAAVVAAELQEANAVDAIAWPAGLDSRRANRLATLVLCNVAPQPRQLWHRISTFSEAGGPDALNMAKSVA